MSAAILRFPDPASVTDTDRAWWAYRAAREAAKDHPTVETVTAEHEARRRWRDALAGTVQRGQA